MRHQVPIRLVMSSSLDITEGKGRWRLLLLGGGVLVLVALSLLRQGGTPSWRTLYAEDGFVFVHDARLLGTDSFGSSYAGYLHIVPRLIAWIGNPLPLSWAAGYFSVAAAFVTATLAAVQFHLTRHLIRSTVLRALLAASLVVSPIMALEVLNNGAYLLWPFAVVAFWALLIRPETRVDTGLAAAVVFLTVASQPVAVVLLPLAIVAAWRRDRRSFTVVGAYSLGAVVQLFGVLGAAGGEPGTGTGANVDLFARAFGLRVFGEAWLGEPWLRDAWLDLGSALIVLLTVATVALLTALMIRSDAQGRAPAVTALAYSFAFAIAVVIGRGDVLGAPLTGHWSKTGTRYFVVPLLLLLGAVVILVDHARVSERTGRWIRSALVLQMVVLIAVGFRVSTFRSHGPEWATSVDVVRHQCAGLPAATVAVVPLTPRGFTVSLPCSVVRDR
jgi:hypothetical protein